MDIEQLASYLEMPEIHREVLRGYSGAYSLGVGREPERGPGAVLILQVEHPGGIVFPPQVNVGGELVPLVVRTRVTPPRPLSAVHD